MLFPFSSRPTSKKPVRRSRQLRFEGLEDRRQMAGVVSLGAGPFVANEPAGSITGSVNFTASSAGGPFSVTLDFNFGTAGPADFTANPLVVNFPAYNGGQALAATFDIPILNDSLLEGTEQFAVRLLGSTDPTVTINAAASTAPATIIDDESGTVTFVSTDTTINEGGGALTFTVQLAMTGSAGGVRLQKDLQLQIGDPTSPDYTLPVLTIPAGSVSGQFTVTGTVNDDTLIEGDEIFPLPIAEVVDNDAITTAGNIKLTIVDNDFAPTAIAVSPLTVLEDDPVLSIDLGTAFADADDGVAGLTFTEFSNTTVGSVTTSISGSTLNLTFTPNRNNDGVITIRATDPDGNFVDNPIGVTITDVNDPPTFTVGPNITLPGGGGVQTFRGFASGISAGPFEDQPLTFLVSNNRNGLFSAQPMINDSGDLTFTFAAGQSGTATVTVVLMDNAGVANGGSDRTLPQTFTITAIGGGAPVATITGPAVAVSGETLKFKLVAVDPDPADQAAPFVFTINWGDGSPLQTVTARSGVIVPHTFTTTGRFRPTVTATDQKGLAGPASNTLVGVRAAMIRGGMDLTIGGTNGGDTFIFTPVTLDGMMQVTLNGRSLGINKICQIIVFGNGGNDRILTRTATVGFTTLRVNAPMFAFGGAGDDLIDNSNNAQPGVLRGEAGNDTLIGGVAKDKLIGGPGADKLVGGPGDTVQQSAVKLAVATLPGKKKG